MSAQERTGVSYRTQIYQGTPIQMKGLASHTLDD